ncbi:hypothetical protein N7447_006839 [Penicillium robsamsonii]|uniref:uncharacterized protein n=1 Tax=Penicillium robsamsonii TaxID=1792511 RepID=UPI002546C804|nr:uncharacterized protein N7447_006839 [Penicillium robsamsonii]KAJ5824499.1 hypothetical protein N7447_006839 [Penicillium robsamsonii]
MPPKGGITKEPRRRKIALACESCREKKVRCDGIKPICGPCARRSYTVDQCVYKLDNVRSASNDEYLKTLHNRIRELEEICAKGGVAVPPGPSQHGDYRASESQSQIGEGMDLDHLDAEHRTSVAAEGLLGLGSTPVPSGPSPLSSTPAFQPPGLPQRNRPEAERYRSPHAAHLSPGSSHPRASSIYPSPSLNSHGNVTAMGAISVAEDGPSTNSPQEQQYYGNSSVASFMRLAGESIPLQSYMSALRDSKNEPRSQGPDTGIWRDLGHPTVDLRFDDFSLPPRSLADHLLECYWDRVHCLFPFFHRPSFEQAYENLWGSDKASKPELPQLNIGLGGAFDCGPNSIVFHCALNSVFALGCHFSDIPPADREAAVYSFFLRAKRFVNLDLLDIGTIGVVQTLLIVSLLLQSTPYPIRCWNAIGLACRAGQGLGLHETTTHASNKPLETEIRRRTWHSCVIMDMVVSMTHGRPSMTSHLSPLPLPVMGTDSQESDPCELSGQSCDHKLGYMTFYVSSIELYKILESVLSEVYNAWQSRSNKSRTNALQTSKLCSLDVLMELDDKLAAYETNVPQPLNWTNEVSLHHSSGNSSTFKRQQNVLRARRGKHRFIHLRLLLYRPMFTQLCSDERVGPSRRSDTQPSEKNIIYSSVYSKCAASCVIAAIDLVSLVHETYRTSLTDAWWYNGFYTSTAGFILIMSCSCHSIREQVDSQIVDESWRKCEEILAFMAMFSLSARNSLQFLQVTHQHIMQNYSATCRPGDSSLVPPQLYQRGNQQPTGPDLSSQPTEPILDEHNIRHETNNVDINPFTTWDEMSMGQEEFGFLGRFDFPDLASWFTDIPP